VFILGDMVVFGLFFGTILVQRGQHPELFRAAQHDLHPILALANTVLLLVGSLLVVRGVARVRAGNPDAWRFFLATSVCALGFATIKSVEYYLLVRDGHTPGTNDFFTYYFAFTGIHLAHLLFGALLQAILAAVTRHPVASEGRIRFVEGAGCYWHMVDGLWLVLFPLLYLVR
jgi:nitric oxide reductase NorE protein